MNCDGFTPLGPITIGHRLALTDMPIRWDSDGEEDVILGILPVLKQFLQAQFTSAAYDLSLSMKMIGDDHPRLRGFCHPAAHKLSRLGV